MWWCVAWIASYQRIFIQSRITELRNCQPTTNDGKNILAPLIDLFQDFLTSIDMKFEAWQEIWNVIKFLAHKRHLCWPDQLPRALCDHVILTSSLIGRWAAVRLTLEAAELVQFSKAMAVFLATYAGEVVWCCHAPVVCGAVMASFSFGYISLNINLRR